MIGHLQSDLLSHSTCSNIPISLSLSLPVDLIYLSLSLPARLSLPLSIYLSVSLYLSVCIL